MRSAKLYQKNRTRKTTPKRTREYQAAAKAAFVRASEQRFGSQGAASPVRKIDPVTGKVIEIIKPN